MNRILEIAELPMLRVPVRRVYNPAEIAKQLLAKLSGAYGRARASISSSGWRRLESFKHSSFFQVNLNRRADVIITRCLGSPAGSWCLRSECQSDPGNRSVAASLRPGPAIFRRRPDREADRDVNQILEIAALPLLRVPVRRFYAAAQIAKQLLAKLSGVDGRA
jgi:hypothetical protein